LNKKGIPVDRNVEKIGERIIKTLFTHNLGKFHNIPGHEFEHSFRVLELALYIGYKVNANLKVLAISSLLHDLGRLVGGKKINHNETSSKMAEEILREIGLESYINPVKKCIIEHSYSSNMSPSTIESAVLQDADRIDALGAIGVARVLAYGGYLGRPIYDFIDPFNREGSLKHFYDKILLLPKLMNTEPGKKIALKRVKFVKYFLEKIKEEIEGDDLN
jgi:uncharacterized protein